MVLTTSIPLGKMMQMNRLFFLPVFLLSFTTIALTAETLAYIPYYRIESLPGAENRLGRPDWESSPGAWDGRVTADAIRSLPDRWDDVSWRTRLARDYDGFVLHIPLDDNFLNGSRPTAAQIGWLQSLRSTVPESRIDLSLIGHSADFLPISEDQTRLDAFTEYLSAICIGGEFDGIDLDWEFSASPRDDERKAIQALAEALKSTLPADRSLSAAVSRWRLPDKGFFESLDRVHLMAYDGYGRHSTLESAMADAEIVMARMDIPAGKMVLGIPFYGRIYDQSDPETFFTAKNYREIVRDYSPSSGDNEAEGYYYNGPELVGAKSRWALETGLAGVFVWEPFYDVTGEASLARSISTIMKN